MRRVALIVLLASVSVSALVGIVSLVAGDFGEVEVKVLLTSLCVTGASILAMACGAAWARNRLRPVAALGVVLAIVGFALVIVLTWVEEDSSTGAKLAATLLIYATLSAHAALLSLVPLRPGRRWLFHLATVFGFLLATLLSAAMWGDYEEEWVWRTVGVLSILLCAFTILTPLVHRLERGRARADAAPVPPAGICPTCGQALPAPQDPEAISSPSSSPSS